MEDDGPSPPNPWRGYRLCLQTFLETTDSHAVVIQDDGVVCRNFGPAVERITEARPEIPICLFVSGTRNATLKKYLRAMLAKQAYSTIWFQDFCPVVAMIWPRAKAQAFLKWSETAKLPGMPNPRSDDAVVGSWMKFTRQEVLATVPSLVEHPDDTPSVKHDIPKAPLGSKSRTAIWFIEDDDPLLKDWT